MFAAILTCLILPLLAQETTENSTVVGSAKEVQCDAGSLENYDMPGHIAAVFIVLLVSAVGTIGSLFLSRFKSNFILFTIIPLVKMFATVWIHLLPDAFEIFSNPCLKGEWTKYGTAYVGLFALTASFLVQLIEFFSASVHGHGHLTAAPGDSYESIHTDQALATDAVVSETCKDIESLDEKQKKLETYVLEAGIIFHSFIIGMALGVSTEDFLVLLIAVSIHQAFEGMALGVLLGEIKTQFLNKFYLALLFPLTTPIGMVVGILAKDSLNSNSQFSILFEGIMISLSAGILMYNVYAELIVREINHNKNFLKCSRKFQLVSFFFMYVGAAGMAVLAIWA
ncbi:hypothetical protein HDV02_000566 [Globomyces sp. JEL0801]|nr:hypothetical protein HDV02_000566 [Globomyces sp. JEL0801]